MRGAQAAALALVASVVTGCGGTTAGTTATPSPSTAAAAPTVPAVPGIEAEAVRLRTDEPLGDQVQVRITATGDEPFTVTSVALDSPGFAPLPPRAAATEFTPGRTIDLPVTFGDPRCDTAAEPAAARLTVVRPDGSAEDLRVPLAAQILTLIHEEDCAVLALAEIVTVAITGLSDEVDAVTGELEVTRRRGEEPVTVSRVGRSVLIDVAAPELPAELPADGDELRTPVEFTPATCEPHVLAETKKPFVFPLEVAVGDDDPVVLDLPVDGALRRSLESLVERVCRPA